MTRPSRRQPEQTPEDAALAEGLKALNRRARTTGEIRARLVERGFAGEVIEDALERLTECGALDDERYAHCFAEDQRELSGWGEERIAATLVERGIDRDLAEQAAREGYADQTRRARVILDARGESLDDDRSRNRALGFLTRRGFAYEIAYDAIRGLAESRR